MSGVVASGVESFPFRQERERCVERKDGKCLKEEKYQARCTRRVINFEADMRVTRTEDGAIVWSRAIPKREERSWCEGDAMPATAEETIRSMIDAVAGETRVALAPRTESYEVRIREGRSGMAKDVSQRFRGAVLATDRDPAAACAEFARLDGEAAAHVSIAFNVALCAEWQGDYARALQLYERAEGLERRGASDIDEGIGRVEAMLAFEEDMAAMAPTAG